jgi:uroporphyrinogen decarboxylase
MSTRTLIRKLIDGKQVERCGIWIGNPGKETIEIYNRELGTNSLEALQQKMGDDVRWITPHYLVSTYRHTEGKKMRFWKDLNPHGMAGGALADASDVEDVENFAWPELKYLDFSETIEKLKSTGDFYRLSGFWTPFYHDLTYLFGTEELLLKMYMSPEMITAALNKLCATVN